jgi:fructose-bisphosphate aldolase, class I
MRVTERVKKTLSNYESDSIGVKTNIARILMHGRLAGTGNIIILPVDQGFEHGPARSYSVNKDSYDPHYHYKLAVEAGLSAYAAPLGWLEAGANTFLGEIPTILKINSSNTLYSDNEDIVPDQAITASIDDALRLGCSAIGFTIYPASEASLEMFEEIQELAKEAKSLGLAVIIWSYARGGNLSKKGETALDVVSYGAHIAALLGANIIKVKIPSSHLEFPEAKAQYEKNCIPISSKIDRIKHIVDCCFQGRRLVVFSGGEAKNLEDVFDDAKAIKNGGGNGSIIGRNCFQRPYDEALKMLDALINIYQS